MRRSVSDIPHQISERAETQTRHLVETQAPRVVISTTRYLDLLLTCVAVLDPHLVL